MSTQRPRRASVFALLILPSLIFVVGQCLMKVAGPTWLGENLDPTYLYLMNSLNVANLHRPYYTDHPGTPIQTIGAVVIRAAKPTGSEAARSEKIFRDPEKYIRLINGVLVFLSAIAIAFAGYLALMILRSLSMALVIQATPFLSMTTLQGLTQLRPEPFLIGLAMLVAGIALLTFSDEADSHQQRLPIVFGLIVGIALAAKINFVPVALLPLVLMRWWKQRLIFVATTGAVFAISIFPILNRALLEQMFTFIVNTASHTGRYGSGEAGFIDPSRYLSALVTLVRGDVIFFLTIVVSVVVLIAQTRRPILDRCIARCLFAVTAAEIFQLLLVAKHPAARYLIPSLSLMGLNVVVLMYAARNTLNQKTTRVGFVAVLVAVAAFQTLEGRQLVSAMRADAQRQIDAYKALETNNAGVPVATYYTASSLAYALAFGAGYSGNMYGSILQKLYPGQFFYSPWTGKFSSFSGPVDAATVQGSHPWFIMRGCSLSDPDFKIFLPKNPVPNNVKLEPLFGTDVDRPGLVDCDAMYKARVVQSDSKAN